MSLFQHAYQRFQAGDFAAAVSFAEQAVKQGDRAADASHLLALIYKQQRQLATSEQWFKFSLQVAAAQPVVWANYANLLQQIEQWDAAETAYHKALQLAPTLADAWHNYGLLARKKNQLHTAITRIEQAQRANPKAVNVAMSLADCHAQLGDYERAIAVLDQQMRHAGRSPAIQKSKIGYLRSALQPDLAVKELELLPVDAQGDWHYLAGCVFYDLRRYDDAENALLLAIAKNPNHIDAHDALNKLYWEHQQQHKFLVHSLNALTSAPHLLALRLTIVHLMLKAGRYVQAQQLITDGLALAPNTGDLYLQQAQLCEYEGRTNEALLANTQALALLDKTHPLALRAWLDQAHYLMKLQRAAEATTYLDLALAAAPDNQEVWAYAGTCWRLLGDARAHWLNDYTQFIDCQFLPVPDGFTDLDSFIHELRDVVHKMHTTDNQPLDQSVRGGTQTLGRLLENPHPLIKKLRQSIELRLQQYLKRLPKDPEHPLIRRNSGKFRFSGSWSVRLREHGFHSNHVHPEGWLSACVYIDVPPTMSTDDPQQRGWLKLGETCLGLAEQENIALSICPQPGLMVIFPSYIWHGTVPFNGENRLTVPCDIMPLN